MKKLVLSYGSISGIVVITTTIISLQLGAGSEWLGFAVMFIALSAIYVAIKQHRDSKLGGVISFKTALLIGIAISAIAAVVYASVWEIYLYSTNYAFAESYANMMIETAQSTDLTEAELNQAIKSAEDFRSQYANPLIRFPMTLLEIFPVGLLVSLVSAALLKNHKTA